LRILETILRDDPMRESWPFAEDHETEVETPDIIEAARPL
jgi:hypothetical protein